MSESDKELKDRVSSELRNSRQRARSQASFPEALPPYPLSPRESRPLGPVSEHAPPDAPRSPDRSLLNDRWDVSAALTQPPAGRLGRLLSPLRKPLQRLLRFALGPLVERQVELNSAQVRFDNELVEYLDRRLDRLSSHYDRVLGLHGKRMEEIDQRHMILQQELIQHVHDLVKRIEFVFETAEQNHLYLEGALRELRADLDELRKRVDRTLSSEVTSSSSSTDG